MDDLTRSPQQFLDSLYRQPLEARRALLEELGRRPSDRSIEILIEVLQGDSWYMRDLAVRALSRIGAPAAPRLHQLLEGSLWYTRAAAARVLGKIGHAASLPDLVRLLADPNHTVQGAVLASLADLIRAGHAREAARLFWNEGARRAEALNRLLLAVHPDAGAAVAELLADPASFLAEEPGRGTAADDSGEAAVRRNA